MNFSLFLNFVFRVLLIEQKKVGTGRCEEDGGPSDDFILRDNRNSINKTNSKHQEATRNTRGSSSVVESETRKHQSLSTRPKKKNPPENGNAVGKESKFRLYYFH